MCDFTETKIEKSEEFCTDGWYAEDEDGCEMCRALEGCGLGGCGASVAAPCGSPTCLPPATQCSELACPYQPPPPPPPRAAQCAREDGRECHPACSPLCLQDDQANKPDYLSKYRYKDFTKYTFDKNKYLPKSYLPGDGADYLYGYGLGPRPAERGAGPCGAFNCSEELLDYHIGELTKPLPSVPLGPPPPPPPCPYLSAPATDGCGAPDCPRRWSGGRGDAPATASRDTCDSAVCPFAEMKRRTSDLSCDNPDCPFAPRSQPCDDKSCPNAKELIICQDCGGVVQEEAETLQKDVSHTNQPETAIQATFEITEKQRNSVSQPAERAEEISTNEERKKQPEAPTVEKEKKKKKKVQETLYEYPGVQVGHKSCMERWRNIPSNMGWLWTRRPSVGDSELWRGYKPGAIPKKVYRMIRAHHRALGIFDPSEIPRKKKSKTSTKTQSDKYKKNCIEVQKKKGNYYVTINPVKDPNALEELESPYVDCTPLQFRIEKPAAAAAAAASVSGSAECDCDSAEAEDSSSDESELEFSFSPPAAVPEMRPRKKKQLTCAETQYDTRDCGPRDDKPASAANKSKAGKKKNKKKK